MLHCAKYSQNGCTRLFCVLVGVCTCSKLFSGSNPGYDIGHFYVTFPYESELDGGL